MNKRTGCSDERSIAGRARNAARQIAELSQVVVKSFVEGDASKRRGQLDAVAQELQIELMPAVSWLEVRDSNAADLLKRRLFWICEEGKACAGCSIPEYAGGTLPEASANGSPSEGAKRTATLMVTATLTAQSIDILADRIETGSAKGIAPRTRLWFVELARDALKEGYRVIAHHLNQVLREAVSGVVINADPLRDGDSLKHAAEQLRQALPGLRTLRPIAARDSEVHAWTLGFINWTNNPQTFVTPDGVDSTGEYDLSPYCEYLLRKDDQWPRDVWHECIKLAVENLQTDNLAMLNEMESAAEPVRATQESEGSAMKDELPSRIWSVQDYYQAKEFYEKRGLAFNPALEVGSPAACHVIAQTQLRPRATASHDVTAKATSLSVHDVRGRVDFGIVTVRADEFQSVLNRLPGRQLLDARTQKQMYQYARIPTIGCRDVGVAVARTIGQGQAEAEALTRDLIDELNPRWLLVVGIAGGIPAHEFSLGDVVVASRLHDFSVSATVEGNFVEYDVRGGPMHQEVEKLVAALPGLAERLEGWNTEESIGQAKPNVDLPATPSKKLYGPHAWRRKVRDSLRHHFPVGAPPRAPLYYVGATASSNTLVKDTALAQQWLESARQIANIEMELAGVSAAARRAGTRDYRVLAIRGISDIIGYRRSPEWTSYACSTAASFAYAIIRSGLILA